MKAVTCFRKKLPLLIIAVCLFFFAVFGVADDSVEDSAESKQCRQENANEPEVCSRRSSRNAKVGQADKWIKNAMKNRVKNEKEKVSKQKTFSPIKPHLLQRVIQNFWNRLLPKPVSSSTENQIPLLPAVAEAEFVVSDVALAKSINMVALETRSKTCLTRIQTKASSALVDPEFDNERYRREFLQNFNPDCEFDYDADEDAKAIITDDNVCILLHVYNYNRDPDEVPSACRPELSYKYELLDPVDLELGVSVRHAVDFAYMPVVSSAVEPYVFSHKTSEVNNVHCSVSGKTEEGKMTFCTKDDEDDGVSALEDDKSLVEEWSPANQWWQWRIPSQWWKNRIKDKSETSYKMDNEAFAGGSHGEVWRGRRKCNTFEQRQEKNLCGENLIFKRLRVEGGYRILEAGLREVYFGSLLSDLGSMFTQYVEHFFGQHGELWIVFRDSGRSLRSFLYTGANAGDFVVYQHSWFWTLLRMSVAKKSVENKTSSTDISVAFVDASNHSGHGQDAPNQDDRVENSSLVGRELMRSILRQILESAAFLHKNNIIHRDIKPSNVMCETNLDLEHLQSLDVGSPEVRCTLGDFSSAYNDFTRRNLYTRGPSREEQTDEYAPPEAMFGKAYNDSAPILTPAFDSWSIGIVALELLLGTPNVFSVDQRTRVVLTHKMQKHGATEEEIEKSMYLAALSQFCIYNPWKAKGADWPLRDGDPLHKSVMTKNSCTLNDFHRALRVRDPLGWGFDQTDTLLHLIWQLLAWDPNERITAAEALKHSYFTTLDLSPEESEILEEEAHNALESQMLDPRMDFNLSDAIDEFRCPKCGRVFTEWRSCLTHAKSRRHAKFCKYNTSSLPTCLHAHSMLPAHSNSGYCDIQGRRKTIEDFHAIHLLPFQQFYGIFDGHLGNFASKYAASFLHKALASRLDHLLVGDIYHDSWKKQVEDASAEAYAVVHSNFLEALALAPHGFMDQSGTTATAVMVTNTSVVISSLGDSRAVLSSQRVGDKNIPELKAIQLTKDHQANDAEERRLVESRGGNVTRVNGVDRVNGILAITRSIGDAKLAHLLSRTPQVIAMTREEISEACGSKYYESNLYPCFMIVASDGLWDTMSNQEAVDMVAEVISDISSQSTNWRDTDGFQRAAEALTHESYVRGSTDNIGVCIIALE